MTFKYAWIATILVCLALTAGADEAMAPKPASAKPAYTTRFVWAKSLSPKQTAQRKLASDEPAGFRYFSVRNGRSKLEVITSDVWQGQMTDGSRLDYLQNFYFANTRGISRSGIHHAACFQGSPQDIYNGFFDSSNSSNAIRDLEGEAVVTASGDGFMLGIEFRVAARGDRPERALHFRIASCSNAGKNSIIPQLRVASRRFADQIGRKMASVNEKSWRSPASAEDGFSINDTVDGDADGLPRFELRADYDHALVREDDRPWKGMDITTAAGAQRFALVMQKYFYEGMANQDPSDPNNNFIAKNNSGRYWCNMPWLNVGLAGREAIHGLTNERALQKSSIFANPPAGSDWGIGYYNAVGCKAIGQVFGSASSPKPEPEWDKGTFDDGTVSAKILFTTADFPQIHNAFTWKANVSEPNATERSIQDVRHIQMDIAVKDSTLKGVKGTLNNWVMITYYYDASYPSPLTVSGLPEGFKHMRPMGIQTGFENPPGDSLIFAGSKTNQNDGKLNGPADNPVSSCLGCHGTAGTTVKMAPGFTSDAAFASYQDGNLDFSQQLALAKRNYETKKSH